MLRPAPIFIAALMLAGCAASHANQQGASADAPTFTQTASEVPPPTLLPTTTESNAPQTVIPAYPPTVTALPLPTPLFTGSRAAPDSVLAISPVGGEWAMGATYNLWAIAPNGTSTLLSTYTPRSLNSPWPRLSPDRRKLAFGVDGGGAVYDLSSGQVTRFPGADAALRPATIDFLAWSVDSQTLYYSVWPQIWRTRLADPDHPQLIGEKMRLEDQDCNLVPALGLPDGRLLMACYQSQRPTAAIWDIASNTVMPLIYQTGPVMVRDVDGDRVLFDTGPHTPLRIATIGAQGELQGAVEVSGPNLPNSSNYTQTTLLPDGDIVASWYTDDPTGELTPHALVLRASQDGYQGIVLMPIEPAGGRNLDYVIAAYGERLIVVVTDTTDARAVMSEVPLDGSPARMLMEGRYQIVVP